MELNGKTALVTGGAAGIGLSMARALLENGASVVIFDLNKVLGEELQQQLGAEHGEERVHFVAGDVTKKGDLERAFKETLEKFSYLDILLNNAGVGDENDWEDMININWVAVIRGTQEALKIMSKEAGGKGGVIINTASVAGLIAFTAGPVYAGTKSAIIAFTRCHGGSEEYEKTGVRFATICPGVTDTDMFRGPCAVKLKLMLKKMEEDGTKTVIQKPEFVADAVMDLIKNAPNGSIWVVRHAEPAFQISMQNYSDLEFIKS